MTARVCIDCGVPEIRKQDARGHEVTNLNPLTGQCLSCMVTRGVRSISAVAEPFDPKAVAARNDA